MEIPQTYLEKFEVKRTSERAELIKVFVENLRDKQGKPYKPSFIGMKLAHVSVPDLYYLVKQCEQANNFGAMFWYSLKVK